MSDVINLAGLSQGGETEESLEASQTISQVYNLLQESPSVHWNGESLRITAPSGLTTISQVSFRSFEGERLPYLDLTMPNLNISVKCYIIGNTTGTYKKSDVNYIMVYGQDNLDGIQSTVQVENQSTNPKQNILYEFDKMWSYDASEENQIDYNVKEIVKVLNTSFMSWLGGITERRRYGFPENTAFVEDTLGYPLTDANNSIPVMYSNGTLYHMKINESNEINYVSFDVSSIVGTNTFVTGTRSGIVWIILSVNGTGVNWTYQFSTTSTSSTVTGSASSALAKHAPIPYGMYLDIILTIPFSIYNGGDTQSLSETGHRFYNGTLTERNATTDLKNNLLTKFNDIGLLGIWLQSGYYQCFVALKKDTSEQIYGAIIGLSSSDLTMVMTLGPKALWKDSEFTQPFTFDDYQRMDLARYSNGTIWDSGRMWADTDGFTYWNFSSTNGMRYKGDNAQFIHLDTYFVTPYRLISYRYTKNSKGIYEEITESEMYNRNAFKTAFETGYLTGTSGGTLPNENQPKALYVGSNTAVKSIFQEASEGSQQILINGTIDDSVLDGFSAKAVVGGNTVVPLNVVNDKITFKGNLFDYDGQFLTYPLLQFDGFSLAFIPFINTSPKYFNISFPIAYTGDSNYSFSQSRTEVTYNTLNEAVMETMEILILQQYEYSTLMFRCYNFPNNDNIVFALGEIARVTLKSMNINGTNMSLMCGIVGNDGEALTVETLKKIYGKLVVNIDFSS